jgi:hypothetical protein
MYTAQPSMLLSMPGPFIYMSHVSLWGFTGPVSFTWPSVIHCLHSLSPSHGRAPDTLLVLLRMALVGEGFAAALVLLLKEPPEGEGILRSGEERVEMRACRHEDGTEAG